MRNTFAKNIPVNAIANFRAQTPTQRVVATYQSVKKGTIDLTNPIHNDLVKQEINIAISDAIKQIVIEGNHTFLAGIARFAIKLGLTFPIQDVIKAVKVYAKKESARSLQRLSEVVAEASNGLYDAILDAQDRNNWKTQRKATEGEAETIDNVVGFSAKPKTNRK